MKVLPYGDRAVLVELEDTAAVLAVRQALRAVKGLGELVPGARTLLVHFDPATVDPALIADTAAAAPATLPAAAPGEALRIAVSYDGPDLAAVASETGLSQDEVIARHTGATYTVGFFGFSPGFAYLTGLDPKLHLPRLPSPRTAVDAGSVAIAGPFAGVYPRSSPGGWRLLGRTDAPMWALDRDPPALFTPGLTVRFEVAP